jgi:hypothetical protein
MLLKIKHNFFKFFLPLVFGIVLISRFLFLDFGLPYVLQADEVEMAEYSLKYAVNLKKFFEGDLYFFKPFSFVYGTLPTYLNTLLLTPFLKLTSYFELSQDRYFIYLYLRYWYAIFSIFTCIGVYLLSKQISKNKNLSLLAAITFTLNYYFLWLSKYLNNDSLIVLFLIYFLFFYLKFQETLKSKYLYTSMLFIGFGIATKITFGLVLAYPFFDLMIKKFYKKLSISLTIVFFLYLITNPFTFIFPLEFINRILEMRVKENGIVIDSYNTDYFKYLYSLINNLTIPVVVLGLLKIINDFKNKKIEITSIIVLIFIVFFSFSQRLVDRWVLPIYPILIINFYLMIFEIKFKYVKEFFIGLVLVLTSNNYVYANLELSKDAHLKNAYLDFIENHTQAGKIVYIVTERGLNPFGYVVRKEMSYAQAPVRLYVNEGAFEYFPDLPENYDFIVFSTRVREYYLNPFVYEINPGYVERWEGFFNTLLDKDKFEVLGFYGSAQKSLINQENIIIFKKKSSN